MIGFSPIAPIISKIYNCSIILVDIQLLLYTILFIPGNFIVIHILNHYNLRLCLILGSLLLLLCAWSRILIYFTGTFTLGATIGNVIGAIGMVFFGNSTSKLASEWFGDKERALSTALGTLAMPIGCIAGFIVPAVMINEED